MNENRFEMIHSERLRLPKEHPIPETFVPMVLKDKVTGVHYLYSDRVGRCAATMTPLLGPDGKPLVDKD